MNLDVLMNLRPAIEEGVRGLLESEGIAAFTRQNAPESFETVRPRVEVEAKIGPATGHRHVTAQGVIQNDTWAFELALVAVFNPQAPEDRNSGIDQLVARLRGLSSTFAQSTWVDEINFPNHLIVEPLKDTTTNDTLKTDENEEWSTLTFSGIVQIRTNAWN